MGDTKHVKAKTIWASDIHIGSNGSQVKKFMTFLDHLDCDTLYLNGDILDKWVIKDLNNLKDEESECIQKINTLEQKNIKVILLPGNHDCMSQLKKMFPTLDVQDEVEFKTHTNKRYLIFHGHTCDPSVSLRANWITYYGTKGYELLLKFRKKEKNSASRATKIIIKKLLKTIFRYEKSIVSYLEKNHYDGVICGHSHQPKIKTLYGKDYLDSGDWIDNCSYLAEDNNGEISVRYWN